MNIQRLHRAREKLISHAVEGFICDSAVDLKYLSFGTITSGKLVITSDEVRLFITAIDEAIYESIRGVEITVCSSYSDGAFVAYLKRLTTCGFEPSAVSFESYCRVISHCPNPVPLKLFIEKMRSFKSLDELELLKATAKLGSRGFDHVVSCIKNDISPVDLARELRTFWASEGASGTAFPPIIAFGEDTAFPHAGLYNRNLKKGEPVLIDIGVELNDYCSDMTRTVFFGQPNNPIFSEIYSVVREAQSAGLAACRAGVSCRSIHDVVLEVIKKAGYEKRFVHGTGHGIGMSVHEYPYLSSGTTMEEDVLEASMVVTVEPGIYLPGIGGVRLENTVVITPDGYIDLTERSISKNLPVIF